MSTFLAAAVTKQNPTKLLSSAQVDDTNEVTDEVSDKQESAQLAPLAKITADDAKKIAIGAVDVNIVGEVTDVELENEDGNVVYAVEFTKNGVETDVKLDAGNGKILKIESDNDEANEDEND
jgi:uncharacterized membrane protein YkoI